MTSSVAFEAALQPFGWTPAWTGSWLSTEHAQDPARTPGRVAIEEKGGYFVHTVHGERLAQLAGRFRGATEQGEAERPVVGDWVAVTAEPGHATAIIHGTLPRKTRLARMAGAGRKTRLSTAHEQVIAANVDTLFLVTALNGDLNPRRLERYLAIAWDSGATPVVLLTKADLCPDVPAVLEDLAAVTRGVGLHVITPRTGEGLEALAPYLAPGKTLALIGSSGVGKTTLINRWLGEERLATSDVSATGEGRHTTTRRTLLPLPGGAVVIDTPGMRELALWEADAGLTGAFGDIEALLGQCKFGDCTHRTEPGCAVRAAVAAGTLPADRLESYLKLQGEMDYVRSKEDPALQREAKRRERQFGKRLKAIVAAKRPGET